MPEEVPRKIFDLMDTETEPTDEQLAELMHYVEKAIRAETAEINAMVQQELAKLAESTPDYRECIVRSGA